MAKLRDGVDKYVDESMPFLSEKLGDLTALKEYGCLTLAQCAMLVPAILADKAPCDATETASHYIRLALLDVAAGELDPQNPKTHIPYSEYLRMAEAGVYGEDGSSTPLPTADWLISLDLAEEWLASKGINIGLDAVRADLTQMKIEALNSWPSSDLVDAADGPTSPETIVVTPNVESNESSQDWIIAAQTLGIDYIRRHKKQDLFPSQSDVCDYIEGELRTRKIYGSHGRPLSSSYIARNAIQGEWWKKNKP